MEYTLMGFQQQDNIRRYAFQGFAGKSPRANFTVNVDLSLIRRYEISVQELPLLCRNLLAAQAVEQDQSITFTEDDMRGQASIRAALQLAAAQKRRPRGGEGLTDAKPAERTV